MYKTKEQMDLETQAVRNLDLVQVAERMGYSFRRSGTHYICREEPQIVVFSNTNSYFNYYEHKGGSVIDFVMYFQQCSFKDAIDLLIPYVSANEIQMNTQQSMENRKPERTKEMYLPPAADTYKRAFAYLNKTRGINGGLISQMMEEKRIYEEAEHHNVIFLGKDMYGNNKHAFIRGTISGRQFRGDLVGSDKNYGFEHKGSDDVLVVFEAPIDMLSYMTIYPHTTHHLLALGMLGNSPIDTYFSEHPGISKLALVLDNDEPGKKAAERYAIEYKKNGFTIIEDEITEKLRNTGRKDVNEYLCKEIIPEMKRKRTVSRAGR